MKKNFSLLATLCLLSIASCNPFKDVSIKSIKELYDGEITIERSVGVSTSQGSGSRLTVSLAKNSAVNTNWLTPASVANNCAVLLLTDNPNLFDKIDVLEFEIVANLPFRYEYRKKTLTEMEREYRRNEQAVIDFFGLLHEDKIEEAARRMKSDSATNMNDVAAFLKTVRTAIPSGFREVKLISYEKSKETENAFDIGLVSISKDGVQRMFLATVGEDADGLKFYSITI